MAFATTGRRMRHIVGEQRVRFLRQSTGKGWGSRLRAGRAAWLTVPGTGKGEAMDARHVDALAKSLAQGGTRRGLLGLLATLPILRGLLAVFDPETASAKGRRKRRKKRHKRAKRRRRKERQRKNAMRCTAHSRARTCANRCGMVKNNCTKRVNCGPCTCESTCDFCQVCDARTGDCVPDPGQQGDACGQPGQRCQADGSCACDATSCPAGHTCLDGTCQDLVGTCEGPTGCNIHLAAECNGNDRCHCGLSVEGATACLGHFQCKQCTSNDDCAPGHVCEFCDDWCPEGTACAPVCETQ